LLKRLRLRASSLLPASDAHLRLGSRGEKLAARHLRRLGYRILARRYDCPVGEIDLIVSDRATIVFVEVKTRTESESAADPTYGFRSPQQQRITRAAQYFLRQMMIKTRPCRFDIVTVTLHENGKPTVEHFKDAFQLTRGRRAGSL
jgi:putative endonuclease